MLSTYCVELNASNDGTRNERVSSLEVAQAKLHSKGWCPIRALRCIVVRCHQTTGDRLTSGQETDHHAENHHVVTWLFFWTAECPERGFVVNVLLQWNNGMPLREMC